MESLWKNIIWSQYGAAIDMLENAIRACPDQLWSDPSKPPEWISKSVPGFWYVAYHTLFFMDYDLCGSEKEFVPPAPFTLAELDPAGVLPERPYTKEELLAYLAHGREKCRRFIGSLTDEKFRERCVFEKRNMSVAELMIHNIRHIQHHTAQLNLMLRQTVDAAPRWVGQTKA
jgi:DinB family protein